MRNIGVKFMLLLIPCVAVGMKIDPILDSLEDQLGYANRSGSIRAQLSGTLELEGFGFDGPAPGLIRSGDGSLFNPRAVLFVDLQAGSDVYGFLQVRLDRGFDPSDQGEEIRLDEFALRWTPWKDARFNLQAGKFSAVVGKWIHRHDSWSNAFVTAPLLYENPTRLSDLYAPPSDGYLTYPFYRDGYYYNPVIWGPAYTTGIALSGRRNTFHWALEFKNAAPMSRPRFWDIDKLDFDDPTLAGRIAWRPSARWDIGLSAVDGNWAGPSGSFQQRDDFQQRIWMFDVSYAYRHLQIWSELAVAEFTAPTVENRLETRVWFVEAKYKPAARLFLAVRWNQQWFSKIEEYGTAHGKWGGDVDRLDLSIGWRFNAHSQIVVEINRYWGPEERIDGWMFSSRFTLRF